MDIPKELKWNRAKLLQQGWCIFIIMNPNNKTEAGIDIIKNFNYLDRRTGNVIFFVPGFSNLKNDILNNNPRYGNLVVFEEEKNGKFYFNEKGFLETVEWLERESVYYKYSEGLDIVLLRYDPKNIGSDLLFYNINSKNFDFQNLISCNLDRLKREGINIIQFINQCKNVLSDSLSVREIKDRLGNFIQDNINPAKFQNNQPVKPTQVINIFIAGSVLLKTERDAIIAALTHITNNSTRGYFFRIKTFEDFDRSLSEEGRQTEYNHYIANEADYVIFALDGKIGGITYKEFEIALRAYQTFRRPEIFVYSRKPEIFHLGDNKEIHKIKSHLSNIRQYYIEYTDIDDLKNHITNDFRRYSI